MKTCKICLIPKSLDEYHLKASSKDGRQGRCKLCATRVAIEWQKANKDRVNQKNAEWRRNNTTASRQHQRRYRDTHKEQERAKWDRWKQENPEKYKATRAASRSKRRAREANVVGTVTSKEIKNLKTEYCKLCAYCLQPATTIDHIVPLNDGGQNVLDNLVPACRSCNSSKQDAPLLVWMLRRLDSRVRNC